MSVAERRPAQTGPGAPPLRGDRGDCRSRDYRRVQWFRAERQRHAAAQALKSEAQVTAKLQEQLRQASWASLNQAERQFQLGE